MNLDIDVLTLFIAILAATLMGAAYATARYTFREWRNTLAKVPVLRSNAISAMLRTALTVAATVVLVFVLASV